MSIHILSYDLPLFLNVKIEFMSGLGFYVWWENAPNGDDVLYSNKSKKNVENWCESMGYNYS